MQLIPYVLLPIVVTGHVALWVALFNRTHGMGIPRPILSLVKYPHMAIAAGFPLVVMAWAVLDWQGLIDATRAASQTWWWAGYFALCFFAAALAALGRLQRAGRARPTALLSNHTAIEDVSRSLQEKPIGSPLTACLNCLPGHQMFHLHVNEKTLVLQGLPETLDGFSVAHLSDLHFSGRIKRSYFEVVVDRANELDADMVAVTGDIIDSVRCLDWLPDTLGRLRGRYGVYFVLGNHDKRLPDVAALRRSLTDLGLVDIGGRWDLATVPGGKILVAGNEWPWFGPRPELPDAGGAPQASLRLLLSHSPDQISWARRRRFDLLLAGHTHGGQIRIPVLGPIFAPSVHGVKYASGTFYESPTLMHVSRGISGLDPIRFFCAPELSKLVLRSAGR